jgi:two-component system OmpR family response regulator
MKSFIMKKVVYIGNDLELENQIIQFFTAHKILTQIINEESEAIELINTIQPDVLLIELQLKHPMGGYELGKKIRVQSAVPIMFASSKRQKVQIAKALYLPHCDHISKPLNIDEMVARMNLLITRTTRPSELFRYQLGRATFIVCEQMLEYNGLHIHLSRLETTVLLELYRNRNQHVDRNQLICQIWKVYNWKSGESSFQNILWKLRKSLLLIEDVTIDTHIKQKIKLCVPE